MSRTRDYQAEYKRRVESAAKRGLTRSQARGHARPGEKSLKPRKQITADPRLEFALKALRRTGKQTLAAKQAGVSAERLRRFLHENSLAERVGRTWRMTDNRGREMTVLSKGKAELRVLLGHDQASLNGSYLNAVKSFLNSNQRIFLEPFEGLSVIDVKGKAHLLETRPNELHRIAAQGEAVFHEIYRLTI